MQNRTLSTKELIEFNNIQTNNTGGFDQRQIQLALQYLFKDHKDKLVYIPSMADLSGILPLKKLKSQGYEHIAFSFSVKQKHQVGVWIELGNSAHTVKIFDSLYPGSVDKSVDQEARNRLNDLLGEQKDQCDIQLSKSPYLPQSDEWSCGVYVVGHLLHAADIMIVEKPPQRLEVESLARQYYCAYKEQEREVEVLEKAAERNDRYKRILSEEIEAAHIESLGDLANFLQEERFGNLDRDNPERKNQSKEELRTRSFSLMLEAYEKTDQGKKDVVGQLTCRLACLYAEAAQSEFKDRISQLLNKIKTPDFSDYLDGYDLCLMSTLPLADQKQKNVSIMTPGGLFQLNEDNNKYKCILDSNELTQMKFDSFLNRAKGQMDQKISIKHELTFYQKMELEQAVISRGGHAHLGKLNLKNNKNMIDFISLGVTGVLDDINGKENKYQFMKEVLDVLLISPDANTSLKKVLEKIDQSEDYDNITKKTSDIEVVIFGALKKITIDAIDAMGVNDSIKLERERITNEQQAREAVRANKIEKIKNIIPGLDEQLYINVVDNHYAYSFFIKYDVDASCFDGCSRDEASEAISKLIVDKSIKLDFAVKWFPGKNLLDFAIKNQDKIQDGHELAEVVSSLSETDRLAFAIKNQDKIQNGNELAEVVSSLSKLSEEVRLAFAIKNQDKIQNGNELVFVFLALSETDRLAFAMSIQGIIQNGYDLAGILSLLLKTDRLKFATLNQDTIQTCSQLVFVLELLPKTDRLEFSIANKNKTHVGDDFFSVLLLLPETARLAFATSIQDKIRHGLDLAQVLSLLPETDRLEFATSNQNKIQNGHDLSEVLSSLSETDRLKFATSNQNKIRNGNELGSVLPLLPTARLAFATSIQDKIRHGLDLAQVLSLLPETDRLEFATLNQNKIQNGKDLASVVSVLSKKFQLEFAISNQSKIQNGNELVSVLWALSETDRLAFAILNKGKIKDDHELTEVLSSLSKEDIEPFLKQFKKTEEKVTSAPTLFVQLQDQPVVNKVNKEADEKPKP